MSKATKEQRAEAKAYLKARSRFLFDLAVWIYNHSDKFKDPDKKYFDYPNYLGMPEKLNCELTSSQVDIIQDHQSEIPKMTLIEILELFES